VEEATERVGLGWEGLYEAGTVESGFIEPEVRLPEVTRVDEAVNQFEATLVPLKGDVLELPEVIDDAPDAVSEVKMPMLFNTGRVVIDVLGDAE